MSRILKARFQIGQPKKKKSSLHKNVMSVSVFETNILGQYTVENYIIKSGGGRGSDEPFFSTAPYTPVDFLCRSSQWMFIVVKPFFFPQNCQSLPEIFLKWLKSRGYFQTLRTHLELVR